MSARRERLEQPSECRLLLLRSVSHRVVKEHNSCGKTARYAPALVHRSPTVYVLWALGLTTAFVPVLTRSLPYSTILYWRLPIR